MIQTLKLYCFCIHASQHTLVLALSSAFLFCTAPCKEFERAEPLWVSKLLGYQHVSLCPPVQPSLKLFWKRCFSTESTDFTPPAVLWSQSLRSSSYCIFNSSLMRAVKCKIQVSAKASFKPRSTFFCLFSHSSVATSAAIASCFATSVFGKHFCLGQGVEPKPEQTTSMKVLYEKESYTTCIYYFQKWEAKWSYKLVFHLYPLGMAFDFSTKICQDIF